jgi:hypothetical protein
MASGSCKRTKNPNLQSQLTRWVEMCDEVIASIDREQKIVKMNEFCRCFVPSDISEEDCLAYAESLLNDEVWGANPIKNIFILF